MSEIYTSLLTEDVKRLLASGFGIGSEFFDRGRIMVITHVGKPRKEGNQTVLDVTAVEARHEGAEG